MKQILNTMTLTALMGLASFANSALAADLVSRSNIEEKTVVLHFGALDPSVPSEASELLGMMKVAARRACMRNDEWRQIFLGADRKACITQSYARAVTDINARHKVDVEAVAARHTEQADIAAAAR